MFSNLAEARKQAETTVRRFYVFEQKLEKVDSEEFLRIWNRDGQMLHSGLPLSEPLVFMDISAYRAYLEPAEVYLVGLATLTPDGFVARQILPADGRSQEAVVEYLLAELNRARTIVGLASSNQDLKRLAETPRRLTTAPPKFSPVRLEVGWLARRYLPKDEDFLHQLSNILPASLEVSAREIASVFQSWSALRTKPADEFELVNRPARKRDAFDRLRFRMRSYGWSNYGEQDPEQVLSDVVTLLRYNRFRLAALIRTFSAACRAAADPGRQSVTALLKAGRVLQMKRKWDEALALYRTALAKADGDDERYVCELRISMFFKAARRWVEALELWNKLADAGVLKAMQELVLFYQRVDSDPAKVLALCDRFRTMGACEADDGWLTHHEKVTQAKLAGRTPPKRQPWGVFHSSYAPHLPGMVDVETSRRKGRIVRYPRR